MLKIETKTVLAFTIECEIGQEGRNSRVYKCYDSALDATLVVKKIKKSSFIDQERFFQESQILYNVEHPNIVSVQYASQDEDYIYIAMQYYPQGSLSCLMQTRFLTVKEIIKYARQITKGISHIHSKGFIHFDIKPDNILLSNDIAMLSDFGLAHYTNEFGLSEPSRLYLKQIPPEAINIEQTQYTYAYDVYQFGLTLYRMCVGNKEFNIQFDQFNNREQLDNAILKGQFPNRNKYPLHIPPKIKKIINKCLNISPDDRYQSVNDICNQLSNIDKNWLEWQYFENRSIKKWTKINEGHIISLEINHKGDSIARKLFNNNKERKISKYRIKKIKNRDILSFLRSY
ncbi:Serine/threonine-protein kinase PknD [Legionella sp. PC1000]|uniref:serine/threonine-protein kinase n=1 Tax=Legionella sp. PC1000 TaxID=2746060 RepID=UPI0015F9A17D|nr:serine/threonine-protein kinase [Legionella sp. PC1000]QLZ70558.1 Serine/threonine-protein kinase PknD [Legionella sp. PC1000]